MKLRLTLTLDLARVRNDDTPPEQQQQRETQADAWIENTGGQPRRAVEYPFGFTPRPEDPDT